MICLETQDGTENNSSTLPPVEVPSTSMSVNRLKIAFDKKITKGIKRVIPRVLAETKRREVNADGLVSESQYIREGGAYSTPQNNIPRYEALNSNLLLTF